MDDELATFQGRRKMQYTQRNEEKRMKQMQEEDKSKIPLY